jgi:hypothetical protein
MTQESIAQQIIRIIDDAREDGDLKSLYAGIAELIRTAVPFDRIVFTESRLGVHSGNSQRVIFTSGISIEGVEEGDLLAFSTSTGSGHPTALNRAIHNPLRGPLISSFADAGLSSRPSIPIGSDGFCQNSVLQSKLDRPKHNFAPCI